MERLPKAAKGVSHDGLILSTLSAQMARIPGPESCPMEKLRIVKVSAWVRPHGMPIPIMMAIAMPDQM
nr:hypothetical protein FRC0137_00406 [Corynebacterium diphtheriae]